MLEYDPAFLLTGDVREAFSAPAGVLPPGRPDGSERQKSGHTVGFRELRASVASKSALAP